MDETSHTKIGTSCREMTEEEYRERITDIEKYVNRTGFGCSRDCPGDFFWHGQALIDYLTAMVEAEFYGGVECPSCPCNLQERFFEEARRFQEKWKASESLVSGAVA
jgi:hypothetical protein